MKQKKFVFLLLLLLSLVGCGQEKTDDQQVEQKINALIANMSLEEKVGQMAQFTIDVLGKGGGVYASDEPFELDPAMMDTVFGKYKVGSILNTSNNRARTTEVWENTVKAIQEKALKEIGIPVIYGIDAIHGTTYTAGATFFPQQIGMAATFDPNWWKRVLAYRLMKPEPVIFRGIFLLSSI